MSSLAREGAEPGRRFADLADGAGRAVEPIHVDGLDRVDDEQGRARWPARRRGSRRRWSPRGPRCRSAPRPSVRGPGDAARRWSWAADSSPVAYRTVASAPARRSPRPPRPRARASTCRCPARRRAARARPARARRRGPDRPRRCRSRCRRRNGRCRGRARRSADPTGIAATAERLARVRPPRR